MKMLLNTLYLVVLLSFLVKLRVYGLLRNNLADTYIQKYLDQIYLERDLIYSNNFDPKEKNETDMENVLANNFLKVHKRQLLNELGGSERLIELIKLLENDAQEEEEENIDEGIELKDQFDKLVLSSNLDSNYYYYITETHDSEFKHIDDFGVNRLRISFTEVFRSNSLNKGIKEYEFKSKVEEIYHQEYSQNKANRDLENDFIKYSSGYYLVKRRNLEQNQINTYKYTIKIESPMEMIDFNELVLLDEIKLLYKKKAYFNLYSENPSISKDYSSKGKFKEFDENYQELESEYIHTKEYQQLKASDKLLASGYPVCEMKCVLRDLQNKVQWTKKIGKFSKYIENGDSENKSDVNIINSHNWCDRLIFHNCIGFELETIQVSIMNEKLEEKVHIIENVLNPLLKIQIEKYFNKFIKDNTNIILNSKQIAKIILLNQLLESKGFIISRNNNKKELLMRYTNFSKFSYNLISLRQILENTKYKIKTNHLNTDFTILSSSYRILTKKDHSLVNIIKPVIEQKFVLDIEQVLIFIQNILFILKHEKSNHKNEIFLPWYNKSLKDSFTKQINFINSLYSEYVTLIKLMNRQRFYTKDRFYRFNIFNIYSLISHFKSYETDNYKNKFGKVIQLSDIQFFVINTSLTYYDQAKINRIFNTKNAHIMNVWDFNNKLNDDNIVSFKYLREYFDPINYENEQDEWEEDEKDFIIFENHFKSPNSIKAIATDHVFEVPKLIKKFTEIKGNIDFDPNDLIFQNNLYNFGFNIAFINYIYQNSLNLDDTIISSPPWWMTWQSQFYPRLTIEKSIKEQDISFRDNPDELLREMNSTWLELPVNSENPNSFLDLGSFIPKEIISNEILESVILEEVELINPTFVKKGDFNYGSNHKDNLWEIIKERQQFYINKWKKLDLINDPSNLFFYNNLLSNKRQNISINTNFTSTKFYFNPCVINIFNESNNSEWFKHCNDKWRIYSILFEQFTTTINQYLSISGFFDLLNEIKILLIIQSQTK